MKKISKKIGLLCGISLCAMLIFATNDMNVYASEDGVVETTGEERATNLQWIYKEFDGVWYMRLYNHNTGQWVTDWVPAVGYPE